MPTQISSVQSFRFSFRDDRGATYRPLQAVVDALVKRGLNVDDVAEHCEAFLSGECMPSNQKIAKRTATKAPVTVKWTPRKGESGKTTVKVAGTSFEFGDSPEARFVELCNRVESCAELLCPIDEIRIAESILRHFESLGLKSSVAQATGAKPQNQPESEPETKSEVLEEAAKD